MFTFLIVLGDERFFTLVIDTMRSQKIISECKAHILRAPVAIGAVKKVIALGDSDGYFGRDIEVDAITDLGHQSLFCFKDIAATQTEPLGEPAL